jgi:hypothetical protein
MAALNQTVRDRRGEIKGIGIVPDEVIVNYGKVDLIGKRRVNNRQGRIGLDNGKVIPDEVAVSIGNIAQKEQIHPFISVHINDHGSFHFRTAYSR